MYLLFINGVAQQDAPFYTHNSIAAYINKYFGVNIYNRDHIKALLIDKAGPTYRNVVVIDTGKDHVIRTFKYYEVFINDTFFSRVDDLSHAAEILNAHYRGTPGIHFTYNKVGHLRQGRSAFSDTIKVDGPKKEKIKYSVSDDGGLVKEILSNDGKEI